MVERRGKLTVWLETSPPYVFTLYAVLVSFAVYFFMFAFRKPFAAATFEGQMFGSTGMELKTALVISQIVGYGLAKFIGIKICAEITWARRSAALVLLIVWAELALLLFAWAPPNLKVFAMFLNGLPLGMVWGMVVGYLEGRRTSEILLAGLSCSFIVASGVVKDIGRALMSGFGVSEDWMPAMTGILFLPGFLLAVWLLSQLPRPTERDEAARVGRRPMNGSERAAFVKRFLFGLVMLFTAYFFVTAYRDFRDNYGQEIFQELGYGAKPAIFTQTELPVAFGVLLALAALNLVQNNRRGLIGAYAIMAFGTLLLGAGTLLFDSGVISGAVWMVLTGLGAFLAYVPYGSVLFDRTIATTRVTGTAVFAIYVADAVGYMGSIGILLYKDLGQSEVTRLAFFRGFTYFMSVLGTVLLVSSCMYFLRNHECVETPVGQ